MRRREFITLLGGAAAPWPLVARAQQAKVWRIGFLAGTSRSAASGSLAGFMQGMRELGYVEGKDFVIEWRFAEGRYERFTEIATEFVRLRVDVIVLGTPAAIRSIQQATSTIPVVMGTSTDPVANGFVASLAHPGGNITGLASSYDDAAPKQLELLAMVVPNLARVGLVTNPENPNYAPVLKNTQTAAQKAGLVVVLEEARNPRELESAFAALTKKGAGAVMVIADPLTFLHRQRIAELALKHQLPSMFGLREYAVDGGLMSYGESLKDFFRRAAAYVDKIFKGVKPADLSIEQPTLFKLVINRKTADALGVTIPSQVYIFADEVIE